MKEGIPSLIKYVVDNKKTRYPEALHEVHTLQHAQQLKIESYTDIGNHYGCFTAVIAARKYYSDSGGCASCCPSCYKK